MNSELYQQVEIDEDELHRRLRKTRKDLGLELQVVAEAIGITAQYLGALEMNRVPGVWSHVLKLAGYYGTTTDFLLGAPWARTPERNPQSAKTKEAMKAIDIIDQYPLAVRDVMLGSLEQQAVVMSALVKQASENIRLRILLEEYASRLTVEEVKISNSTVAERLAQILAGNGVELQ